MISPYFGGSSLFFAHFGENLPIWNFRISLYILYISLFGISDLPTKTLAFPTLFNHSPYFETKISVSLITPGHPIFDYQLHGITLQTTKNAKYLGLNISDDLTWSRHINQTAAKGNNTLKFIKRNIQTHNSKIKETAYKTYVRPLLEYSSSVWDPWQKKYIKSLEMVQHRAVRYIFNDYGTTSSVTAMLNKLSLPTLENRQKISSLVMFYKINTGLVRISLPPYTTPSLRNRFTIPFSRINAHKYSFFPRTARLWNNLPSDLVSSPDLESFRAGLARHFQ